MIRRFVLSTRRATERVLPRGAILLSVLTFAGYAMGLVRDRTFARTFGAGTELDAYNAAFVLPELALDVLVAGGLAAPFVPIFLSLRHDRPDDGDHAGRSVRADRPDAGGPGDGGQRGLPVRARAGHGRRHHARASTLRRGRCTSTCSD